MNTIIKYERWAPAQLLPVVKLLESLSDENYIVGGAVRDIMRHVAPNDFDLVTDVPMDVLVREFEANGFECKKTGVAFLVLNVWFGGYEVEIANFRKDVTTDGRHAEVEVGTIEEDAFRRDFTVNAMYLNTKTGELVDPTGQGASDIASETLRFVGKPHERIREDYLRVWRAFRIQKKLGFRFSRKTERALRELFKEAYDNSNPQRVLQEMIKLSKS